MSFTYGENIVYKNNNTISNYWKHEPPTIHVIECKCIYKEEKCTYTEIKHEVHEEVSLSSYSLGLWIHP